MAFSLRSAWRRVRGPIQSSPAISSAIACSISSVIRSVSSFVFAEKVRRTNSSPSASPRLSSTERTHLFQRGGISETPRRILE